MSTLKCRVPALLCISDGGKAYKVVTIKLFSATFLDRSDEPQGEYGDSLKHLCHLEKATEVESLVPR